MVNRAFHFSARAGNLTLQRLDAGLEFRHRKRVEILPDQHRERIARRLGQQIVRIHAAKVDPNGGEVN